MNAYNHILSTLRIGKQPSNNGMQPTKTNEAGDLAHTTMLLEFMQKQIAEQQKQIDALKTKQDETADLARVTTLLELMQTQVADQQKQIDALTASLQSVNEQLAAASPSHGELEASKCGTQTVVLNNR